MFFLDKHVRYKSVTLTTADEYLTLRPAHGREHQEMMRMASCLISINIWENRSNASRFYSCLGFGCITTQVNILTQMAHSRQMLLPPVVQNTPKNLLFKGAQRLFASQPLHIPLLFQTFRRSELINKSVYYLSAEVGDGFADIIGSEPSRWA